MGARRSLSTYSAPNLFRNGAFETGDEDFWEIFGAGQSGFPALTIVKTDEVDSPDGCLNYAKAVLPSTEPISIEQTFLSQIGEYVDIEPGTPRFDFLLGMNDTDASVFGCPLSIGASIRVIGGSVAMFARFHTINLITSKQDVIVIEMSSRVDQGGWKRFVANFDGALAANQSLRVVKVGIQLERRDGSPEINVGKLQLVEGLYTIIPYTGCLASMAFQRNSIVMSMGREAPPGFEPIYEAEDFFIYSGAPGSEGGNKHHEHVIDQRMSDHTNNISNDDWYKRAFLADKNVVSNIVKTESEPVFIDDGRVAHSHDIESPGGGNSDNTTPLWKGYMLCRKK